MKIKKEKKDNILGENLKKERLKRNLSQAEIAEKINKTGDTYSKYERGMLTPDVDTLILLAQIYETTIEELTGKNLHLIIKAAVRMGEQTGYKIEKEIKRQRATKKTIREKNKEESPKQ